MGLAEPDDYFYEIEQIPKKKEKKSAKGNKPMIQIIKIMDVPSAELDVVNPYKKCPIIQLGPHLCGLILELSLFPCCMPLELKRNKLVNPTFEE